MSEVSLVIPHCPLSDDHDRALQRCVKSYQGAYETIVVVNQMGFGPACNLGIRLARCEYVAVVNNDTYCAGQWILSDLCRPDAVTFPVINGIRQEFSGAFLVFPRWVIHKLQAEDGAVYDERFEVGFWEDVDLWTRLKKSDVPFRQLECEVAHPHPGFTMKDMPFDTDTKNKKRYLEKHDKLPLKSWS